MWLPSFKKLIFLLHPRLELSNEYAKMAGFESTCCKIVLHFCIHYLEGGSNHDICATACISKPAFYNLDWHTIHCVNRCEALKVNLSTLEALHSIHEQFMNISRGGIINRCVGHVDGYLMRITAPFFDISGNVGAYCSGHYCTYGVSFSLALFTATWSFLLQIFNYWVFDSTILRLCIDNQESLVHLQSLCRVQQQLHHPHDPHEPAKIGKYLQMHPM